MSPFFNDRGGIGTFIAVGWTVADGWIAVGTVVDMGTCVKVSVTGSGAGVRGVQPLMAAMRLTRMKVVNRSRKSIFDPIIYIELDLIQNELYIQFDLSKPFDTV